MRNMDRTRIIFIVIVGLALLLVCAAVAYNVASRYVADIRSTATSSTAVPPDEPATPVVQLTYPDPIYGPNYDPNDGLPVYICGADAFGSARHERPAAVQSHLWFGTRHLMLAIRRECWL